MGIFMVLHLQSCKLAKSTSLQDVKIIENKIPVRYIFLIYTFICFFINYFSALFWRPLAGNVLLVGDGLTAIIFWISLPQIQNHFFPLSLIPDYCLLAVVPSFFSNPFHN
jgi:hypothetical protein